MVHCSTNIKCHKANKKKHALKLSAIHCHPAPSCPAIFLWPSIQRAPESQLHDVDVVRGWVQLHVLAPDFAVLPFLLRVKICKNKTLWDLRDILASLISLHFRQWQWWDPYGPPFLWSMTAEELWMAVLLINLRRGVGQLPPKPVPGKSCAPELLTKKPFHNGKGHVFRWDTLW